jgi:DNA-binding LacI/PurR family transcriptional regulator
LLRAKRTYLIGIFASGLHSSYSALKTDALVKALRARPPYKPLFIDPEVLRDEAVNHAFGFELLEGLFWSLSAANNDLLHSLVCGPGAGPQVVTIGYYDSTDLPVCSVVADIAEAAYQRTEYLIAQGHTRIAILHDAPRSTSRRFAGHQRALKAHGLPLEKELCLPLPQKFEPDSYYQAGQTLAERVLSSAQPPTAIVCHNDEVAAGALYAAYRLGLSVPRDVSVAGFDGTPLSQYTVPPLTTVELPITEMVAAAVDLMIRRIEGGPPEKGVLRQFTCTLRLGESCASPGRFEISGRRSRRQPS